MKITGAMLIGESEVFGTRGKICAFNPATGTEREPDFGGALHPRRKIAMISRHRVSPFPAVN